jgi:hypothetical protein
MKMQENDPIEEYVAEDDFEEVKKNDWKGKWEQYLESKYFWVAVVILVGIISFCLGRASYIKSEREPVRVINKATPDKQSAAVIKSQIPDSSPKSDFGQKGVQVVGSKNGTKYHLPSCPGAKQISEKNKITFNSIEEAKAKGYTPASNCKGLK